MARNFATRLSWLDVGTSGGLSPIQLLLAWLIRHYTTYINSDAARKIEMLEALCQGMSDAGYECTVFAIRSKIDGLRREVRQELNLQSRSRGTLRHSSAFQQYRSLLMEIFHHEAVENDEDAEMQDGLIEGDVKFESDVQDGTRSAPFVVDEDEDGVHRGMVASQPIDVGEIRRRYELLCARHELQRRGVATDTVDRMLPLPEV